MLGVGRAASTRELRRARNHLLLSWHPDRTQDPEAADRAARINAAYEVLSDPDRRTAYDHGTSFASLASMVRQTRPVSWAPPTTDGVRAAAQQRVVDRFKDDSRRSRPPARRWSDTVAWPSSARQIRARLLWRALPFALLAVASLIALPRLDRSLPQVLLAAVPYVPLYFAAAVLRGIVGRATTFGSEGWGRFTVSWLVGVAAIVVADRWLLPHLPVRVAGIRFLLPALLLLLAALAVYRITRAVRLPA
ncbi:MAG: J domain-containing protein [Candidatus Dormibacteraeota bacterium]|nr:J domain-containing protein [Candidatus Dormibacteraeota bacterium]